MHYVLQNQPKNSTDAYLVVPDSTYHELMLLAPGMSFQCFLREVQEKATTYILSERPSKRLLSKEKVVFVPVLKLNVGKGRFLRRSTTVKSTIDAQNWSAVVATLQDKSIATDLKVKFWTERPALQRRHCGRRA